MNQTHQPADPILVVDDEEHILLSFDTELRESGYNQIITLADSTKVMPLLEGQKVALIFLDLWMPRLSGEELLNQLAADHPDIPVIVVTGLDNVETAVRCMKAGAFDYLVKPLEEGLLGAAARRALTLREMSAEISGLKKGLLRQGPPRSEAFDGIITQSPEMLAVFKYIEAVAPTSQPVMITGETGVGKELAARAVHLASGRAGPFVAVNAAGLDDHHFTDTLFGHKKGAFTSADSARTGLVEHAAGGTLFLDEIGDLPQSSQVKLLRLIQEGEYTPLGEDPPRRSDARIVAASNRRLESLIENNSFRRDLYYRLQTHQFHLPPLRERSGDLRPLIDHFLEKAARELGKEAPTPPPELYTLLGCHDFPGNIRELSGLIFDAVSRHQSGVLSLASFKKRLGFGPDSQTVVSLEEDHLPANPFAGLPKLPNLARASDLLVEEAMSRTQGNITQAAAILGLSRQALSKRLNKG